MNKAIATISGGELEGLILARAAKSFYTRSDLEKFDLFPFYSILVSTGINKNTDAFDPIQLYRAKNSPIDKPVNIGHDQKRIVGHMMDCICVGEDLKQIPENVDESDLPEKLHLITSAVIYRVWENPHVQAEINTLIDKISKGSIYVSMETLFRDFDFLLTNASTGEQRLLQRNEKTIGLTKYLRQYKGPGKIHNYTIARLLKSMTFSAVGIVDKPANPDSIISNNLDLFSTNNTNASELVYIELDSCKTTTEIIMPEKTQADTTVPVEDHPNFKALRDEHDSLKHQHKNLQDDHDRMKKDHDHLHGRVAELNGKLDEVHRKTLATEASVELEKDNSNPPETGKKKLKGPDKSTYASNKEASMADTDNDTDTMKEMATLKARVTALEKEKEDIEKEKASLAKANDAQEATLNEFRKASRHSNRAESMMGVDSSLTRETALQSVAKFDELSDAGFAGMLELMKGYASRAPKEVTASDVVNAAKAEKEVNYGASDENSTNKTTADIKAWMTSQKKSDSKKG